MAKKPNKKSKDKEKENPKDKDTKPQSQKPEKKGGGGYPWWAKLIVGFVAIGWIAFAASMSSALATAVTMVRQATEPAYIASTAAQIAHFENQLPPGFKYQFAGSLFNVHLVNIAYAPDGSLFLLSSLPPSERHDETSRSMADKMAEQGIPAISNNLKVEDKGSLVVGGEKLEYVLGVAADKRGHKNGGMIGCILLKNGRTILVYGLTPDKSNSESDSTGRTETVSTTQQGSGSNSNSGTDTRSGTDDRKPDSEDTGSSTITVSGDSSMEGALDTSKTDPDLTNSESGKTKTESSSAKSESGAKAESSGAKADTGEANSKSSEAKTESGDAKKKILFNMDAAEKLLSAIKSFS